MKWPIIFVAAAVVVVLGVRYWPGASAGTPTAQVASNLAQPVLEPIPKSSAAAPSLIATNVALASQPAPVTAHLRRVVDSPDVMATINDIRKHGTADERDWAIPLLYSCALLFQHPLAPIVEEGHVEAPKPVDEALEARKKRAFDSLAERCKGVKGMTSADRTALREALAEPAIGHTSALRELNILITEVRDGRWNEAQAQLITNSLYSDDPFVAREAFRAMLGAMDSNAPGGNEREHAFLLAVGGIYDSKPITEYDRLEACYTAGHWCDRGSSGITFPAPSATVLQLASKYRAAVDSHMDARGLMAIR